MTVADALAAGIPTVASAIPAHRELAALAGSSAWLRLVDPEDEAALVTAVRAAAAAGRSATAAPLPTWDDVVAATREVYSAVTGMPVPPTGVGAGGR